MRIIAYPQELPERNVHSFNQMKDGNETSASSNISETERDQILGRRSRRRRVKPKSVLTQPPEPTPRNSKDSLTPSWEKVPKPGDNSSFEIVPYPLEEHSSMKGSRDNLKENQKRANCQCRGCTIESDDSIKKSDSKPKVLTQTIGVQTSVHNSEIDFRYPSNRSCDCKPQCECPGCHCGLSNKKINVPEEPSRSNLENQTSSKQSLETTDTYEHCDCYWRNQYDAQSTTDPFSDNSDESYTTDFFDLPYQNNEEYLKLLRELEKKLVARNRERVRKTMLEFEKRSRQNQNLDKPIFDYDYNDDSCLLRKLTSPRGRHVCCKCGKSKKDKKVKTVNSDIMQNEKRWDEMNIVQSVVQTTNPKTGQNPNASRLERSVHKSHWQLDPRSGEWIKVSCYQQTDYARHPAPPQGDYLKDDPKSLLPPVNVRKKGCQCRQKRRR